MNVLFLFQRLALVATVALFVTACGSGKGGSDNGGSNSPASTGIDPVLQNDFGGSGAAINTSIAIPFVLFQDNDVSRLVNRDGGLVQRNGVSNIYSFGAYADVNDSTRLKLFVNDRGNSRVLIYNNIPLNAAAEPDVVVGQTNFTSGSANAGGGSVSASGFSESVHVSVCSNGKMFVADRANHRVLGFNAVPTTNGAAADFVIGQVNLTSNALVNPPTANSLANPYATYCMADKLFVLDRGNNRVLVYDPIPTADNPTAAHVVGQPDMATNSAGCSATKLNTPYEILRHGNNFYIADGGNHRVLEFSAIPNTTGVAATTVLGQTNMTTCLANETNVVTPSQNSLNFPNGLAVKGSTLAVSDHNNNRIMFFTLPLSTHQAAFRQFGQADFTSAGDINPPTANSVSSPKGLIFDTSYLWITEGVNNRLSVVPFP